MKDISQFSRFVRKELKRLSLLIKQMEFMVHSKEPFLRRTLRTEIRVLKRRKEGILTNLARLKANTKESIPDTRPIREELRLLAERCRNLKAHYL